MKLIYGAITGVAILVVIAALAGSPSDNTSPSGAPASTKQPVRPSHTGDDTDAAANKLADVEAGRHLAGSDPLVREIARHLSSLDRKCRGTEAQVAGYIDFAASDLAKYGVQQTRSSLAAQLDKNINGFPPNFDCQGFVAAYLVLRESK